MHPILETRNMSKRYGGSRVVDDVSLSIEHGALFSLLGPSGCGKTTTLRMIAGFERPDSGDILLNGARVNALRPYERNVSTVFQNYALFPYMSARANIEFGLKQRGATEIARRVREVVELVQLEGKESQLPASLSGGERQRVALARSLVIEPDVLLLDEPLSALDPILRKQVRSELRALQKRVGITFLLVTHDQEEALSVSDRVAIMNAGRIEQAGPPREIYTKPRTRFAAGFLGPVNWIDAVGIRPEAVRIGRAAPGNGEKSHTAVIEAATFLGSSVHIESRLTASGRRIMAEVPRLYDTFAPGDSITVWWHAEDELVFPPQ